MKVEPNNVVNVKSDPWSCSKCGKLGALHKCTGCMRVAYCSKSCQVQHWRVGGHKRDCKQLKLKLTAKPMGQPQLTAKAGAVGSSASCFICLDGDDEPCPTPLGCACRGNAGFAHTACIEGAAMADGILSDRWYRCMTCKQAFTGAMELELAIRRWARVCDEPKTNKTRLSVAMHLANALDAQGQHAAAAAMRRETLKVQKRVLG